MRFIIYGAGGIGATIGARLHQQGEEVVLVARGQHLEALRAGGLTLIAPDGRHHLEIPAVGHPAEIRFSGAEVVLLCVKSQHTVAALDDLRAAAGAEVPVVCVQNGVANERAALRRFANVYAMVVILPALHLEPGVVITHGKPGLGGVLDLGRYPTGDDGVARAIGEALTESGFSARADADVMRWKYAKLLMNLDNALQAATEMADGTREISRMMKKEALACYAAAGIRCASVEDVSARRIEGFEYAEVPGVPRGGGSSWQSVARGTGDIETDYLNGEIVLLGRLHGVPTPANAVVQALGHELVNKRLPAGSISVAEVRRRLSAAQSRLASHSSSDPSAMFSNSTVDR